MQGVLYSPAVGRTGSPFGSLREFDLTDGSRYDFGNIRAGEDRRPDDAGANYNAAWTTAPTTTPSTASPKTRWLVRMGGGTGAVSGHGGGAFSPAGLAALLLLALYSCRRRAA